MLTSLDDADLREIGHAGTAADEVLRLSRLVADCGLDGVVCSAAEAATLRAACGADFKLVTPGIRPADAAARRPGARRDAARRRARWAPTTWSIGRPITQAADPLAALHAINASLAAAAATP